jgi:hypothetical protein
MPTPTYNLIQEITVSGSVTTSVSFTSIPTTFDDLVIVFRGRTLLNEGMSMRFNSDSGTNYAEVMHGAENGTGVNSVSTTQTFCNLATTCITNAISFTTISAYNNSNWRKPVFTQAFTELGTLNNVVRYRGNQWFSTATISTISIFTSAGTNYIAGSVFQLYGIKGSN